MYRFLEYVYGLYHFMNVGEYIWVADWRVCWTAVNDQPYPIDYSDALSQIHINQGEMVSETITQKSHCLFNTIILLC